MSNVKLTWVNHASFIIESGDVRFICDPWIEGRVFNQSWDLLAKTVFTYGDFKNITHLWFSHEHPDHFFPPNILKIPVEYRSQITVLYQKTMDGKVKEFCGNAGFKRIIEMSGGVEYNLGKDFRVINNKVSNDTDSWLIIKTGGKTFLNLNDCVFRHEGEMKKIKGLFDRLDVLFTQFSYASWVGNKGDAVAIKSAALAKKNEIRRQLGFFKPVFTVPFASFVWFCHTDNYHMNQEVNKVGEIASYISGHGSHPVVLYPGQQWDVSSDFDSSVAIGRYSEDAERIVNLPLTRFPQEAEKVLTESADSNRKRCLKLNNRRKLLSYKAYSVFLSDHSKAYSYSYASGLKEEKKEREECDIAMSSQSLKYCLDHDWGYNTIQIAACFEKPAGGNFSNFEEYMWIGSLNNRGERMGGVLDRAFGYLSRFLGQR